MTLTVLPIKKGGNRERTGTEWLVYSFPGSFPCGAYKDGGGEGSLEKVSESSNR